MGKYIIIDEETGEYVSEIGKSSKKIDIAILTREVNDIISKGTLLNKEEFSMLISLMYIRGDINKHSRMRMSGNKIDEERTFGLIVENGDLATAFSKLLLETSFNNMVKKNSTTICSSWDEVHEVCKIENKTKKAKFKKFLVTNNIVKKVKCIGGWRMFVNPKVKKVEHHASQKAIIEFWEDTKEHISEYSKVYFYSNGDINEDELRGKK